MGNGRARTSIRCRYRTATPGPRYESPFLACACASGQSSRDIITMHLRCLGGINSSSPSVSLRNASPSVPHLYPRRRHPARRFNSVYQAALDISSAVSDDRDEPPSSSSSNNNVEEEDDALMRSFSLPQALRDRNAALVEDLRGQLILAPLTRGNHLPFRRWCMEMGCSATMSEMAFAKTLLK